MISSYMKYQISCMHTLEESNSVMFVVLWTLLLAFTLGWQGYFILSWVITADIWAYRNSPIRLCGTIIRWYPAKRALLAMLKHGR